MYEYTWKSQWTYLNFGFYMYKNTPFGWNKPDIIFPDTFIY